MSSAIDAMIVIWGLKQGHYKGRRPTTQDVGEMRRRAVILLDELHEAKEEVIIRAVAVAELLLGIEPKNHGLFVAKLQENFRLPPFDLAACSLASRLWQTARELPKDQQQERVCLKADVMIVATAKVAGTTTFYSHEPKVRKIAEMAGMTPKDLPTQASDLFADHAARKAAGEVIDDANP